MNRYEQSICDCELGAHVVSISSEDGDWVGWEDHEAEVRRIFSILEKVRRAEYTAQGKLYNCQIENAELRLQVERLAAALSAAVELKWTDARERLPEQGEDILFNVPSCYGVEKGRRYGGRFVCDRTTSYNDEISFSVEEVTVWMPVPESPDDKSFEEFQSHLKDTANEVRAWPDWKLLGGKASMGYPIKGEREYEP